jgi:myo-inositol-1(or 4)-monophosphatase
MLGKAGGDHMRRPLAEDEKRWLVCALRMAEAGAFAAAPLQGTVAGRVGLGQGAGGDRTMEIDRACEEAILRTLKEHAPAPYRVVSEESGSGGDEGATWRVVLDPLDGSLNAKRGLEPFCVSIAVADGPKLADVRVAHIQDYLRPHSFTAVKGAGVLDVRTGLDPTDALLDSSRFERQLVEVVLLEAGRPDRHHFRYHDLSILGGVGRSRDLRVRQIGSLALSLCYVAMGVADVLVAAVRSRSVDIAAGLAILAEAGGGAATLSGDDIGLQPLDLEKRCAFVAWRAGLDGEEIVRRARRLETALLGPG